MRLQFEGLFIDLDGPRITNDYGLIRLIRKMSGNDPLISRTED